MNIKDMDERQLEEKRKCDVVTNKIIAVINLLGMTVHKTKDDDMRCYWRANEFTEPDQNGLTLHFSEEKGRIYIRASYPRTAKGEYIRPTNYNEAMKDRISVSVDKTAEQIAKDVKSRLLPVAMEYLARVTKQIKSSDDYENTTMATLKALKGAMLDEYEMRSKEIRLNVKGYCHAKVSRNDITLTIDSLDLETAKKIIALIPKESEEGA